MRTLLLLSAAVVVSVASYYDTCDGGLIHDPSGSDYVAAGFLLGNNCNVLMPDQAQLFEYPTVPWVITRVCRLVSTGSSRTQTTTIRLFYALQSAKPGGFRPGAVVDASARPLNVSMPVSWNATYPSVSAYRAIGVSIPVYTRRVFVGSRILGCTSLQQHHARTTHPTGDGLAVLIDRIGEDPACLSKWCGDVTNVPSATALALRVVAAPYVPRTDESIPGWQCERRRYWDGAICDCGCGLEDPDCTLHNATSANCSATEFCREGACAPHGWNTSRPGCDPALIGTDGVCQCGCGRSDVPSVVVDPDCRNASSHLSACPQTVPACVSNVCVETWNCTKDKYQDGAICNCGCGAVDPDCLQLPPLPSDCKGDFVCRSGLCVPGDWSCNVTSYDDGHLCHCGCSAPDPDCNEQWGKPAEGCNATRPICNSSSLCVVSGCGNGVVDRGFEEQCDGAGDPAAHCTNCRCDALYQPAVPVPRPWCVPVCGDGILVAEEDCETSARFCNVTTCKCLSGHQRMEGERRGECTGCGNGILELGEECESSGGKFRRGCNSTTCHCLRGFANGTGGLCTLLLVSSSATRETGAGTVIAIVVTASVLAVLSILVLASALVYLRCTRRPSSSSPPSGPRIQDSIPLYTLTQATEAQENPPQQYSNIQPIEPPSMVSLYSLN